MKLIVALIQVPDEETAERVVMLLGEIGSFSLHGMTDNQLTLTSAAHPDEARVLVSTVTELGVTVLSVESRDLDSRI